MLRFSIACIRRLLERIGIVKKIDAEFVKPTPIDPTPVRPIIPDIEPPRPVKPKENTK